MGGLANRIRVLAYAIKVAQECNSKLTCFWSVDSDLHAPFNTLFYPADFPIQNVYGRQWQLRKSRKWYKNIPAYIWLKLHHVDVWLSYDHVNSALKGDSDVERDALRGKIVSALNAGKNVYLATGEYMGAYTNISFITPLDCIMQKVNETLALFTQQHSRGLHIRRTDNTWAIEHSPIELFEKKIEEIITADSLAKFYLATDDNETANYLCAKYGDRIVYRSKELSRTTESGMQEAVIDMWILGNMSEIYGSYWSSFSEVASWINNKPLYCISDANKTNS